MEQKKNLAASINARLLKQAKEKGEEFQSLLTRFANERLLYRLSQSGHKDKFILKGATLFSFWFNEPHRPTKDMDLLGFGKNDIPTLENIFREICVIGVEDGLQFLADTIRGSKIREGEMYEGVRINLIARLEQARISVQVDVGFGDAITPAARKETLQTILDLPAPRLKIYPKETVVAEKFEAMVKLGIGNGRMKDFWDVQYLIKEVEFDGALLQKAIKKTFANRQTTLPQSLPTALSDVFATDPSKLSIWGAFIKRNNIATETDLAAIIKNLREFFVPLIEAEANDLVFNQTWNLVEGWK